MTERGRTTAFAAIGLLAWTFVVDIVVVWFGLWTPTEFDDAGAVEGDFVFALAATSLIWLVGAIVVVWIAPMLAARTHR